MNRRLFRARYVAAMVLVLAAIAILSAFLFRADTTLEFRARDSVSGRWVWDLDADLQGRRIRAFYQSDSSPAPLRFNHLRPGKATLALAAPSYEPVSVPVDLRRGVNRVTAPVDMTRFEIPDLDRVIMFENLSGSDIAVQVRLIGSDGKAIPNQPCMDLWIGASVYVQVKGGVPVRQESESGSERGDEVFHGRVDWQWDAMPETLFRYSARIPGARIKVDPSLYRIVDYVVVVPDPRRITRTEVEEVMTRAFATSDDRALANALDAEKGRLRYFLVTSLNVKAREQ